MGRIKEAIERCLAVEANGSERHRGPVGIYRAANVMQRIKPIVLEAANHCYVPKMRPKTLC